jgi:hypothetical protein
MSIAFVFSIIIILSLFFYSIKLKKSKTVVEDMLLESLNVIPTESEIIKEDFLKFVSDSREWAYDYIEEVQKAIKDFKTTVEPHITFFDKFGDVLSNQRPDYDAMKTISIAYKELITILPEENDVTT